MHPILLIITILSSIIIIFIVISTSNFVSSLSSSSSSLSSKRKQSHYDPGSLLNLGNINKKHLIGNSGKGIKIAILDTGIQYRHHSFSHRQYLDLTTEENCQKFTVSSSSSSDCLDKTEGHGTFVASEIIGNNYEHGGCGVYGGIAKNASLLIAKVFSDTGASSTSKIVDAMNYVLTRKSLESTLDELFSEDDGKQDEERITLMTLSTGSTDFLDEPFNAKIDELVAAGITVVVASGNSHSRQGFSGVLNPADRHDVVAVGGVTAASNSKSKNNNHHQLSVGTSFGLTLNSRRHRIIRPDISTFSENIFASLVSGGCGSRSGTSVAAPIVTGALALAHEILLSSSSLRNKDTASMVNPAISKVLVWKSGELSSGEDENIISLDEISSDDNADSFLDHFRHRMAFSYLGVGAGALNVHKMLELAHSMKNINIHHAPTEIKAAFFPPNLNFIRSHSSSAAFFPLDDLQLPLYPTSVSPLIMNITFANGNTKFSELIFEGKIMIDDDETEHENNKETRHQLNADRDLLKISLINFDEKKNSLNISPYFGVFGVKFEALEDFEKNGDDSNDDMMKIKITKGTIHFKVRSNNNDEYTTFEINLPFHVSHLTTPPPKLQRLLWIANKNALWPEDFAASDDMPFDRSLFEKHRNNINNKHRPSFVQHHSDAFETSNDDPLGGSPLTFALFHMKKKLENKLGHRLYIDVLTDFDENDNLLSSPELLSKYYSSIIIFDPEKAFTRQEVSSLRKSIEIGGVSLVVVADWYNEDFIQHFSKSNPDRKTPSSLSRKRNDQNHQQPLLQDETWIMGGSHLPSLNEILEPTFGVSLSTECVFSADPIFSEDGGNSDRMGDYRIGTNVSLGPINSASMIKISSTMRNENDNNDKNNNNIHLFGPRLFDRGGGDIERSKSKKRMFDRSYNSFQCMKLLEAKSNSNTHQNVQEVQMEVLDVNNDNRKRDAVLPMIGLIEASYAKNSRAAIMTDTSCFFNSNVVTRQNENTDDHDVTEIVDKDVPCVDLFSALVEFALTGVVDEQILGEDYRISVEDAVLQQKELF